MSRSPRIESGSASPSDRDRRFLVRAVELGREGWGRVHPNPMVGALVVRDGSVLAKARHETFGGPHAEVIALAELEDARGSTLYTSLEPCRHKGKTPPCTEAILEAGVSRVVFWASDPGADAGGGGEWLRSRGLQVDGPFGERSEWAAENPLFFHASAGSGPYVALKLAVSLDGRIAPAGGRRVWLTGEESRAEVHRLRAGFDAILVGTRTWRADDPLLTPRGPVTPRVPPARVLLDRRGRLPVNARTLRGSPDAATIVVTSPEEAARLESRFGARADVLAVPVDGRGLDLAVLLEALGERGVTSVLCEGGGVLAASLLGADLVHRFYLFVAPVLMGDGGVPAFPPGAAGGAAAATRHFRGWKSRLDPVRFGNDTLIVLDRGD